MPGRARTPQDNASTRRRATIGAVAALPVMQPVQPPGASFQDLSRQYSHRRYLDEAVLDGPHRRPDPAAARPADGIGRRPARCSSDSPIPTHNPELTMNKLRLHPEELRVESFATVAEESERGTVQAHTSGEVPAS